MGQRWQLGSQRHILRRSQIVDEVICLKDKRHMVFPVIGKARPGNVLPVKIDLAAAGAVQAADQGEQGGFAAAGRPQDGVKFALFHFGVDAF